MLAWVGEGHKNDIWARNMGSVKVGLWSSKLLCWGWAAGDRTGRQPPKESSGAAGFLHCSAASCGARSNAATISEQIPVLQSAFFKYFFIFSGALEFSGKICVSPPRKLKESVIRKANKCYFSFDIVLVSSDIKTYSIVHTLFCNNFRSENHVPLSDLIKPSSNHTDVCLQQEFRCLQCSAHVYI